MRAIKRSFEHLKKDHLVLSFDVIIDPDNLLSKGEWHADGGVERNYAFRGTDQLELFTDGKHLWVKTDIKCKGPDIGKIEATKRKSEPR